MRRIFIATAIITLLTGSALWSAPVAKKAEPARNAFKTKPKSVAIFKDGYGFF